MGQPSAGAVSGGDARDGTLGFTTRHSSPEVEAASPWSAHRRFTLGHKTPPQPLSEKGAALRLTTTGLLPLPLLA